MFCVGVCAWAILSHHILSYHMIYNINVNVMEDILNFNLESTIFGQQQQQIQLDYTFMTVMGMRSYSAIAIMRHRHN